MQFKKTDPETFQPVKSVKTSSKECQTQLNRTETARWNYERPFNIYIYKSGTAKKL